jgi:hypothetical protein
MEQVLENQAKDMPELNDMFLRYKQLKKKIKAIPIPKETTSGNMPHASLACKILTSS